MSNFTPAAFYRRGLGRMTSPGEHLRGGADWNDLNWEMLGSREGSEWKLFIRLCSHRRTSRQRGPHVCVVPHVCVSRLYALATCGRKTPCGQPIPVLTPS